MQRSFNISSKSDYFQKVCHFIIRFGTLAHQYGTQSKRLDTYLTQIIRSLGYDGIFKSTPHEIQFVFIHPVNFFQETHLTTFSQGGFNLYKMSKLDSLASKLLSNKITLEIAIRDLELIEKMPKPYHRLFIAAAYALVGASYAAYQQCSFMDIILSALLSILVFYIVEKGAALGERFEHATPIIASFTCASIATIALIFFPYLQVYMITLAAVIYLIPGLSISNGVIELTHKYILSGLTNIINGLFYLMLLFSGAWLGVSWVKRFFPIHPTNFSPHSIPAWWILPSLMLLCLGLCLIVQTPLKNLSWSLLGCLITCGGIFLGLYFGSINLGNFLGTLFAVLYSNYWSVLTKRAASLVLLPSIILLVSGSIGFKGILSMSLGQTALGQKQFSQMFIVAAMIAIGLIIGNLLSRPNQTL